MHKCLLTFTLGTSSGFCILVKSYHYFMFQEDTNGLYFCAKFEVLSYGDINQNTVIIGIFTLGTESCMKLRVKSQKMNVGKLMH